MKTLVIYDSVYGNTEIIAQAIGNVFSSETKVMKITEVDISQISPGDLVFIGSPTQGGKPTKAVQDFLSKASDSIFKDVDVAVFDTSYHQNL